MTDPTEQSPLSQDSEAASEPRSPEPPSHPNNRDNEQLTIPEPTGELVAPSDPADEDELKPSPPTSPGLKEGRNTPTSAEATPAAMPPKPTPTPKSASRKPTIPTSPQLAMERRGSSAALARRHPDSVSSDLDHRATAEVDLARTYQLKPTIPTSPRFETARRASVAALVHKIESSDHGMQDSRAPAVVDLARTYELKPTVPKSPRFLGRRVSMSSAPQTKEHANEEVDLARTYVLKPTTPKSPRFLTEQRAAVHTARVSFIDNADTTVLRPANVEPIRGKPYRKSSIANSEPDLAHSYELKPTTPKSPRLSAQVARSLSMVSQPTASRQAREKDLAETYVLKPTKPTSPRFHWRPKKKQPRNVESPPMSEPDLATTYKLEPTKPMSPRIHFMRRRSVTPVVTEEPKREPFRARPMPDFSAIPPAAPRRWHGGRRHSRGTVASEPHGPRSPRSPDPLKPTEPAPFRLASLDRHERYLNKLQSKLGIESVQSRESVPKSTKSSPLVPTTAKPFALASLRRHERAAEQFNRWMAENEESMRRRRQFKAIPLSADMLEGATFVPTTGQSAPTQPQDVVTASRDRAQLRKDFDRSNAERIEELARCKSEEQAAREAAEDELIRTQYREHGFRARPVPQSLYRAPEPAPSTMRRASMASYEPAGADGSTAGGSTSQTYSPRELFAGVRRAIGRLSPRVDSSV